MNELGCLPTDAAIIDALLKDKRALYKVRGDQESTKRIDYFLKGEDGHQTGIRMMNYGPGTKDLWFKPDLPSICVERWFVENEIDGWTLNDSNTNTWAIFTFHPDEHTRAYALHMPTLRKAFRSGYEWWVKRYGEWGGGEQPIVCYPSIAFVIGAMKVAPHKKNIIFYEEDVAAILREK